MIEKTIFAETITPETGTFTDVFMVQEVSAKRAKNDSQYLNLTLRDRTGDVDAKVWGWDGTFLPAVGMVLKVEVEPGKYKNAIQLKVLRMREVTDEEVNLDDFLPASKRDRDEMRAGILNTVRLGIRDDAVRALVLAVIENPPVWDLLRDAPAAKGTHQPYLGGLLEHIDNLIVLAQAMGKIYQGLDVDLLIAAAVIHDIGKVYELNFRRSIDYSRRGKLVGHVVIGLQMFHEACASEPPIPTELSETGYLLINHPSIPRSEKLDHLEHIICSHHGRKEWGAPVTPMSREAVLFHLLDMIDSRMGGFDEIQSEPVDAFGFSSWMKQNDGPIWRPVDVE